MVFLLNSQYSNTILLISLQVPFISLVFGYLKSTVINSSDYFSLNSAQTSALCTIKGDAVKLVQYLGEWKRSNWSIPTIMSTVLFIILSALRVMKSYLIQNYPHTPKDCLHSCTVQCGSDSMLIKR